MLFAREKMERLKLPADSSNPSIRQPGKRQDGDHIPVIDWPVPALLCTTSTGPSTALPRSYACALQPAPVGQCPAVSVPWSAPRGQARRVPRRPAAAHPAGLRPPAPPRGYTVLSGDSAPSGPGYAQRFSGVAGDVCAQRPVPSVQHPVVRAKWPGFFSALLRAGSTINPHNPPRSQRWMLRAHRQPMPLRAGFLFLFSLLLLGTTATAPTDPSPLFLGFTLRRTTRPTATQSSLLAPVRLCHLRQ